MQHVDPSVGWDDPDYTRPPPTERRSGGRQWATAYVVFTAVASVVYLWSISVPGMRFLSWMVSVLAIALVVVIWVVAAVVTVVRLATGRTRRAGWYLLVVPLIGAVVVLCRLTDLPVRVLFEPSRAEFTDFAERALAASDGVSVEDSELLTTSDEEWDALNPETPQRIGAFELWSSRVLPEGVIIYERNGAFFDDAGFAYLPDGELPAGDGSFESPDFRSLGGGWYAFTSSW